MKRKAETQGELEGAARPLLGELEEPAEKRVRLLSALDEERFALENALADVLTPKLPPGVVRIARDYAVTPMVSGSIKRTILTNRHFILLDVDAATGRLLIRNTASNPPSLEIVDVRTGSVTADLCLASVRLAKFRSSDSVVCSFATWMDIVNTVTREARRIRVPRFLRFVYLGNDQVAGISADDYTACIVHLTTYNSVECLPVGAVHSIAVDRPRQRLYFCDLTARFTVYDVRAQAVLGRFSVGSAFPNELVVHWPYVYGTSHAGQQGFALDATSMAVLHSFEYPTTITGDALCVYEDNLIGALTNDIVVLG